MGDIMGDSNEVIIRVIVQPASEIAEPTKEAILEVAGCIGQGGQLTSTCNCSRFCRRCSDKEYIELASIIYDNIDNSLKDLKTAIGDMNIIISELKNKL